MILSHLERWSSSLSTAASGQAKLTSFQVPTGRRAFPSTSSLQGSLRQRSPLSPSISHVATGRRSVDSHNGLSSFTGLRQNTLQPLLGVSQMNSSLLQEVVNARENEAEYAVRILCNAFLKHAGFAETLVKDHMTSIVKLLGLKVSNRTDEHFPNSFLTVVDLYSLRS